MKSGVFNLNSEVDRYALPEIVNFATFKLLKKEGILEI